MTGDIFERGPLGRLAETGVALTEFLGYLDDEASLQGTQADVRVVGIVVGDEAVDRPDLLVSFDELNTLTGFDELDRMDEKYSVAETIGHAAE